MQTIYTLFHGDANAAGLRLFVSPLIGKDDSLNRIIFSLQSLEAGKEKAMFTAFVDPKKMLAVAKVFIMGTFKEFFPEGFFDWGKSSPRATVDGKVLIEEGQELRCIRFRQSDESGVYTLGITIYATDSEVGLRRAYKPLVMRLSQQEALEMLASIESFINASQLPSPEAAKEISTSAQPTVTQTTLKSDRKEETPRMAQTTYDERKLAVVLSSTVDQMDAEVQKASAQWNRTEEKGAGDKPRATSRRRRHYAVYDSLDLACLFTTDGKIDLRDCHEECLYLVYLDSRRHLITTERARTRVESRFSRRTGRYQSLAVDTRHLLNNMPPHTYWVGFVHNHPGEDVPTPSVDDRIATKTLRSLVERQQVNFLDHVIIGNLGYYSFADDTAYASYEPVEE